MAVGAQLWLLSHLGVHARMEQNTPPDSYLRRERIRQAVAARADPMEYAMNAKGEGMDPEAFMELQQRLMAMNMDAG